MNQMTTLPSVEPPRPARQGAPTPVIAPEVGAALATLATESEHLCERFAALTAALMTQSERLAALHEQIERLCNGDRQALGRLDRLCTRLDRLLDHLEARTDG